MCCCCSCCCGGCRRCSGGPELPPAPLAVAAATMPSRSISLKRSSIGSDCAGALGTARPPGASPPSGGGPRRFQSGEGSLCALGCADVGGGCEKLPPDLGGGPCEMSGWPPPYWAPPFPPWIGTCWDANPECRCGCCCCCRCGCCCGCCCTDADGTGVTGGGACCIGGCLCFRGTA